MLCASSSVHRAMVCPEHSVVGLSVCGVSPKPVLFTSLLVFYMQNIR